MANSTLLMMDFILKQSSLESFTFGLGNNKTKNILSLIMFEEGHRTSVYSFSQLLKHIYWNITHNLHNLRLMFQVARAILLNSKHIYCFRLRFPFDTTHFSQHYTQSPIPCMLFPDSLSCWSHRTHCQSQF